MRTDQFLQKELQNIHSELKKHLKNENATSLLFQFDELNLAELISNINCEKIFFFKSKYKNYSFLGLGQSQIIKAQHLKEHLRSNPGHLLIATFLFDNAPDAS